MKLTVRPNAATLLASAAAQSGDRRLAVAAIHQARLILAEAVSLLPGYDWKKEYRDWNAWATSYAGSEEPLKN